MKPNKQKLDCNIMINDIGSWSSGNFQLRADSTYTLIITYPFSKPANFKIKVGKRGMDFIGLMPHIKKCYIKKYESAEIDDDDGYWHGIEDLALEGAYVDHKKKEITLD